MNQPTNGITPLIRRADEGHSAEELAGMKRHLAEKLQELSALSDTECHEGQGRNNFSNRFPRTNISRKSHEQFIHRLKHRNQTALQSSIHAASQAG